MCYNLDPSCCLPLSNLLNLQLMSTIKAFKQTGPENYTRDNKSAAVVRQITAGSVILQRGRMSPLKRMRWPVQVQTSTPGQMYFTEVLFGGNLQVSRRLLILVFLL